MAIKMNAGIGINEFADYWEKLIEEIKECELTKEDSAMVLNQFEVAKLRLEMSKPPFWYTWEIVNRLEQLRSELRVALLKAQSNYRKGYGKSKIEAISQSIKEFLKTIQRRITS
jgi:hypothetical protein